MNRMVWLLASVVGILACAHQVTCAAQPGQLIRHPRHPEYLTRKGSEGDTVAIVAPGDPEGFLYLGTKQGDGTRAGGQQQEIIDRMIAQGGNALYCIAVRSYYKKSKDADGDATQNPFINDDPYQGVNHAILDQWDAWLTQLDNANIATFLFLYDDGSRPFGLNGFDDSLPSEEIAFVQAVVQKFAHLKNLVWVIAEEYEDAYRAKPFLVSMLAKAIKDADVNNHLVGGMYAGVEFSFDQMLSRSSITESCYSDPSPCNQNTKPSFIVKTLYT
eukprot:m.281315 g.281315  ORF g.281315 m.281315 type:complete len:273 (+) comp15751_c6_seq14:180-998(+)